MTNFDLPLCSTLPHPDSPNPVSSVTTIIDLEDCSLRQMWNLRSHLQEASELATANYPETLNTIAVVNSPSFFPTVWNWIKVFDALIHNVSGRWNHLTFHSLGSTRILAIKSTSLGDLIRVTPSRRSSTPKICPRYTEANLTGSTGMILF